MANAKQALRDVLGLFIIVAFGIWSFSWSTHTIVWLIFIVLALILMIVGTLFNAAKKTYTELKPFIK